MNIENMLKKQAVYLKMTSRNIDIAPDISDDILRHWKKKYKSVINDEIIRYVLVLSDTKTGSIALTGDTLYYDNFLQNGIKCIKYNDITGVSSQEGGLFSTDKIYISTQTDGKICLDGAADGINIKCLQGILTKIIELKSPEGFLISEQNIMLCDMEEDLKLLYLKILCNYAYIDDQLIDAKEYNTIAKFSVRIELGEDGRKILRCYMNNMDVRQKTGTLIREIKQKLIQKSGIWDILRYSLMQDALAIHNVQNPDQKWTEDGFIGSLMETLNLCPEQLDTMVCAVKLNEKMQKKNADIQKLKEEWKALVRNKKNTKGDVPAKLLFCSGSIYGLSCYSSIFKKEDTGKEAINKQREIILQEIIMNTQKTVNVIIGDINFLAERLDQAINEGENVKERLKKLIYRLKTASDKLNAEKDEKEKEVINIKKIYGGADEDE